ncbi:MAG: hypothetical protein ACI8RZ_003581, partial [Myxococcota bacterium]
MSITLPTTITAVTIYRNGALVTRTGTLRAPPAPTPLHIPGLPHHFTSDTLRIRVTGGSADAIEELPDLSVSAGEEPADKATLRALEAEKS